MVLLKNGFTSLYLFTTYNRRHYTKLLLIKTLSFIHYNNSLLYVCIYCINK